MSCGAAVLLCPFRSLLCAPGYKSVPRKPCESARGTPGVPLLALPSTATPARGKWARLASASALTGSRGLHVWSFVSLSWFPSKFSAAGLRKHVVLRLAVGQTAEHRGVSASVTVKVVGYGPTVRVFFSGGMLTNRGLHAPTRFGDDRRPAVMCE